MVTSLDVQHASESVIDGQSGTFWITTGLYPQEIIVRLGQPGKLSNVKLSCAKIRHFRFEGCAEESPVNFKVLAEAELEDIQHKLQVWERQWDTEEKAMTFVKLVILSGWDDFCAVSNLQVHGQPPADEGRERPRLGEGGIAARRASSKAPRPRGFTGESEQGMRERRPSTEDLSVMIPQRTFQHEKAKTEPDAPRMPDSQSPWDATNGPDSPKKPRRPSGVWDTAEQVAPKAPHKLNPLD